MFCPGCGNETDEKYQYCLHCGTHLSEVTKYATRKIDPSQIQKPRHDFVPYMLGALGACVLLGLVFLFEYLFSGAPRQTAQVNPPPSPQAVAPSPSPSPTPSPTPKPKPTRTPTPEPTEKPVIAQKDEPEPTPTPRMTPTPRASQSPNLPPLLQLAPPSIYVRARNFAAYPFTVSSDNSRVSGAFRSLEHDIDVFIMSQAGYAVYHSGRTQRGTIGVTLAPGRYTLLFDNRYSLLTPKTINSAIYLRQQ